MSIHILLSLFTFVSFFPLLCFSPFFDKLGSTPYIYLHDCSCFEKFGGPKVNSYNGCSDYNSTFPMRLPFLANAPKSPALRRGTQNPSHD